MHNCLDRSLGGRLLFCRQTTKCVLLVGLRQFLSAVYFPKAFRMSDCLECVGGQLADLSSTFSLCHSHSHHALPAPLSAPPSLLRPPRRASRPRLDWLPAGEAPRGRQPALGRGGGNRGVFPGRPRLPRLPPRLTQQRNALW